MASLAEIREIIETSPFFCELGPESLGRLAEIGKLVSYVKGAMVFRQDDPCPGLFVVGSGTVRIFKLAASGKEHVLHIVGPGATFAEVAVIGRFPCPAFAQAVEDTRVVLLPAERFVGTLETNHTLCLQLMGSMARWVRHFVGLMEDIVLRDAGARLARHLLQASSGDQATFALPNLKKDLASHLNLTPETFSRTLRRLADAGLIQQVDKQRLRILHPDKLQDLADGVYPEL